MTHVVGLLSAIWHIAVEEHIKWTFLFTYPILRLINSHITSLDYIMDGQDILNALRPILSPEAQFSLPFAAREGVGAPRWTEWKAPTWKATVKPATVEDVQKTVKFLTKNNEPFLAVGSGHGYSAQYGKAKDIVQIDINNFKDIDIDKDKNTMKIGGAVLHREVIEPLWKVGKQIRKSTVTIPCS